MYVSMFKLDYSNVIFTRSFINTGDENSQSIGYARRLGVNTLRNSSISFIVGINANHRGGSDTIVVTLLPFSFEVFSVYDSIELPIQQWKKISQDFVVISYTQRGNLVHVGNASPTACRAGFGFNEATGTCQPCSAGFHQFVLENEPKCEWDSAHDSLTLVQKYAISGFVYATQPGFFVVEDSSTYLIDCYSSFCTGFQTVAGISGKSYERLSQLERDLYKYNNISINDNNGCAFGHTGIGCTHCVQYGEAKGVPFIGFYNIFTQGCITIRRDIQWMSFTVFFMHITLFWLAFKFYYVLGKLPWTVIFNVSELTTDYDVFKVLDIAKDYLIILWPIVFSSTKQDLHILNGGFYSFAFLFLNPLGNISTLFGFLRPIFPLLYLVFSFALFNGISFKTSMASIVLFTHTFMFYQKTNIAHVFMLAGYTLFVILRKKPKISLIFVISIMYYVYAFIFLRKFIEIFVLCVITPFFYHFTFINAPHSEKILSANYFFLPYIARLVLLQTIPISSFDVYGISNHRYYHTLADYESEYNPFSILVFALCIAFFNLFYRLAKKSDGVERVFFFFVLLGRTIFGFISYISHSFFPNQICLLAILIYIILRSPFKLINAFMLRVTIVMIIISSVLMLYSSLALIYCLSCAVPTCLVVYQSLKSKKQLDKSSSALLNNYFN
ncbi:hypothetical protein PCE1_001318 [Barthelona sp. PCE]